MLNIRDIIIDAIATLGDKLLLVGINPAYEYKDGKQTEHIVGYKYQIASPRLKYDKVNIKVEGKQLVEMPVAGYVEVSLTEPEIYGFTNREGKLQFAGRAKGISLVTHNKA